MKTNVTRRAIVGGATTLMATGLAARASTALAQGSTGQSGGLGLPEAEIASLYGPGSAGQSFMYYTHPTYGVDLHVGFDNDAADYIWLALGDEQAFTGLPLEDAWQLAGSLLPSDAQVAEIYLAPESPGSIGQIETRRYTSDWLGEALAGRESILVAILSYPGLNDMSAMVGTIQVTQRM